MNYEPTPNLVLPSNLKKALEMRPSAPGSASQRVEHGRATDDSSPIATTLCAVLLLLILIAILVLWS